VHHITDKAHLGDKFIGGDASYLSHQPLLADKGVGGGNDVEGTGIKHRGNYLKIKEAGVIYKEKGRFLLAKTLHTYPVALKSCGNKVGQRHHLEQSSEEHIWLFRLPVLFLGARHNLFVAFVIYLGFHIRSSWNFIHNLPMYILSYKISFFNICVLFFKK
jgi:hypothetical protein